MPSYYVVVQYVPDPVSDERLNVGVVTLGDGVLRSRFLRRWARVRAFSGGRDISFLRNFAEEVRSWSPANERLPALDDTVRVSETVLQEMARRWVNSIQLTEPRASTLDSEHLLADVAARFLYEPRPRRRARDRRAATRIAYDSLLGALTEYGVPNGPDLVHRRDAVEGAVEEHSFDVTVRNSHLVGAIQALSFESGLHPELEREIDATAWTLADAKSRHQETAFGVMALPPRSGPHTKAFSRAERVFTSIGADLILEDQIDEWSRTTLHSLRHDTGDGNGTRSPTRRSGAVVRSQIGSPRKKP